MNKRICCPFGSEHLYIYRYVFIRFIKYPNIFVYFVLFDIGYKIYFYGNGKYLLDWIFDLYIDSKFIYVYVVK